jgi:Ca-activated chloride channel family protein
MVWEHPSLLWLLLLVPALAFAGPLWRRRLRERRRAFFSDAVFARIAPPRHVMIDRFRSASLLTGLVFLILALAGPKIGTEVREVRRQGIDILVAVDLSLSMKAEDVRPNRLDKAKFELIRLVDRLKGDRIGLLSFTGEALLQVPLTNDYSAFKLFLNIANPDLMPSTSTDFSAVMRAAGEAYAAAGETSGNAARVLLILSDGEDHGADIGPALEQLVQQNITIFTVGIGTPAGAAIPIYDERTGRLREYKRDTQGNVVTTALQRARLEDIARAGNGAYFEILRPADGLDPFLGRIAGLEKQDFATQEYADYENRFQWPLLMSILLFATYFALPSHRRYEP